jgi:hypothetical protein
VAGGAGGHALKVAAPKGRLNFLIPSDFVVGEKSLIPSDFVVGEKSV